MIHWKPQAPGYSNSKIWELSEMIERKNDISLPLMIA